MLRGLHRLRSSIKRISRGQCVIIDLSFLTSLHFNYQLLDYQFLFGKSFQYQLNILFVITGNKSNDFYHF